MRLMNGIDVICCRRRWLCYCYRYIASAIDGLWSKETFAERDIKGKKLHHMLWVFKRKP